MRLFLGDQSVVITKDLFFVPLRRRTVVFAIVSGPSVDLVVSSSCVNSVFEVRPRRAGGLACVRTRESESL